MHPSSRSSRALFSLGRPCALILFAYLVAAWMAACADDKPAGRDEPEAKQPSDQPVPLNKQETVLLDKKNKRVLLKTHVVQRERSLELLCCLKGTKEHESILSLDSKAYVAHAGLLALGAKPGTPMRYDPETQKYHPPTGQRIDIFVNWTDKDEKPRRASAKSWIRQALNRFRTAKLESLPEGLSLPRNSELKYDRKLKELSWYGPMTAKQRDELLALSEDKDYRRIVETFYEQSQPREMKADWVFAGSGTFTDEDTGKNFYLAEDGDLLCVANFGSAMIDIALESTASDSNLEFEAYTERVPEIGTEVTVELVPVTEEKGKNEAKKEGARLQKIPVDAGEWKIRFDGYGGTQMDRSKFKVSAASERSILVQKWRRDNGPRTVLKRELSEEEAGRLFEAARMILNDHRNDRAVERAFDGWNLTLEVKAGEATSSLEWKDQSRPEKWPPKLHELAKIINGFSKSGDVIPE